MSPRPLFLTTLFSLAALASVASGSSPAATTPVARSADAAKVERGRFLIAVGGCNDCHTPLKMGANGPEPDMARMLSGHPQSLVMPPAPTLPPGPWAMVAAATSTAWSGPWGVSFTANLTPDEETGLGAWTEKDFIAMARTARHQGRGRAILPPMPVQSLAALSDDELSAVFAYLRTIPAVRNRVPEPIAPAPVH